MNAERSLPRRNSGAAPIGTILRSTIAPAKDPEGFWAEEAKHLDWFTPWQKVLEWNAPWVKWFVGGKLNVTYNCVDRHAHSARRNKAAIIWEGEPGDSRVLTYGMLEREVNRFANALKSLGVVKGDRVAIYMGMVPELAIAMLACAKIGAPHSVVFGGFSAEALRERINDAKAKVVITADGAWRRGTVVPLKASVDEALTRNAHHRKRGRRPSASAKPRSISMKPGRDLWWHDLIANASDECAAEPMDAEDMLFILYTSGTTGKPKGIVHTTAGYLVGVGHDAPLRLRHQGRRRLLVHRRHRLGHRPHLRRLRPAGQRRDRR